MVHLYSSIMGHRSLNHCGDGLSHSGVEIPVFVGHQ
jgi:hypothetical protein